MHTIPNVVVSPEHPPHKPTSTYALCSMLDARDVQHPQTNGDVISNPWDSDPDSPPSPDSTVTTPRLAPPETNTNTNTNINGHGNGNGYRHRHINGSASTSSLESSPAAKSGLRSRRAGSHRRVLTMDVSSSLPSHPLQSPTVAKNGWKVDETATRPALRRLLSYSEGEADESEQSSFDADLGPVGYEQQAGREAEVIVIVHEVKRTDSMAGVALKYGITLADLRKVNHLWASDSIHLRKVLYIPLHLSSRKHLFYTPNDESESKAEDEEESNQASSSTQTSVVIQRIPISQLAFFPPPSQSSLSSPLIRKAASLSPTPPRIHSEASGPGAFSSLLHSLSLPSRDALFSRLSLDSGDASFATNTSGTSSDYEHEMDVLDRQRHNAQKRRRRRTPTPSSPSKLHRNSITSIETLRNGPGVRGQYDVPLVAVQTEQLKPSPRMELPRALKKDEIGRPLVLLDSH